MRIDTASTERRVWTVPAAAVLWSLFLIGISLRVLIAADSSHNVFLTYHLAGGEWLAGQDMYGVQSNADIFHYSPLVGALLAPFSLLPVKLGGILWRLLNVGVYLGGLTWTARSLWPELSSAQRGWLFLLIIPMSISSINNGQCNALVLGLILLTLAAAHQERWTLAGSCMAGAVLFKLYPIAVAMLLMALFPRRLAARFAIALIVGLLVPFALQSPSYVASQYTSWFNSLSAEDRSNYPLAIWLRDIRFLFKVWLVPMSNSVYLMLELAVGAGMAALCLLARREQWSRARLLTLALGFGSCWMIVVGPMVEACTFILLAPILALSLVDGWRSGRSPWLRAVLTACLVLFVLDETFGWWRGGRDLRGLGAQPLAALVLLITFTTVVIRDLHLSRRGLSLRNPRVSQTQPAAW